MKRVSIIILQTFVFSLLSSHLISQQIHGRMIVSVDESFQSTKLKSYIDVYATKQNLLASQFLSEYTKGNMVNKILGVEDYIWVLFTVDYEGDFSRDLLLEINNPHLDYFELYKLTPELEPFLLANGGDSLPFNHRKIKNRRFIETIPVKADTLNSFLLYLKDIEHSTSIALELWDEDEFYNSESKENLLFSIYFGGLFFIGFFSLIIGLLIKLRIFYSYGLYAMVMAFYMLTYLGFDYPLLFPGNAAMKQVSNVFMLIPLFVFMLVFTASYFNISKSNKKLSKILIGHFVLSFLVILFWIVSRLKYKDYVYVWINYGLLLFTIVIIGLIVFKGFKTHRIKSWFFILAVGMLVLSGIVFGLADANIIPMNLFPINPLLMGSMFEFGVFAVALIYEVKTMSETRNKLLRESAEHQKKLLSAYVTGAEKERSRLSGELHDNIGSRLALLSNKVKNLKDEDEELYTDVDELFQHVRSLSHELSPGDFKVITFEEYITIYLQNFRNVSGIDVRLITNGLEEIKDNISAQLFRVIQEASQNVLKYAYAKLLEVQVIGYDEEIILTIDDNGVGFNTKEIDVFDSKGISNMRTRIQSLGGVFDISSTPGKGTHIMCSIS